MSNVYHPTLKQTGRYNMWVILGFESKIVGRLQNVILKALSVVMIMTKSYSELLSLACSRRSESFLGDQFLPQIRGQEETKHVQNILFSAVNWKEQAWRDSLDTNESDACFAGYIITILSLLFDPSPHEICFGPPSVKLFFKPEPPLREHSGGWSNRDSLPQSWRFRIA